MRKILLRWYLCIVPVFGMLVSCNQWLDVEPSDQIGDGQLFDDAMGFRSLLNGIYSQMASQDLYGCNLTWGLASFMGQDYTTASGLPSDQAAQRFDYENKELKQTTSAVWTKAYNTITNCNKLIFEIDGKDETFFPQGRSERNLILGEAMAVRALMHFEMIRLFAPSPATGDKGSYIPYYKDFNIKFQPSLPTADALDLVISDLLAAKDLVAENDTITNKSFLFSNSYNRLNGRSDQIENLFFTARGLRLNYVAVNGLLARVYLYAGKTDKAREYAEYVYSNFSPEVEEEDVRLGTWSFSRTDGTAPQVKLIDDVLFALSDSYLASKVEAYRSGKLAHPPYLRNIRTGLESMDMSDDRFKVIEMRGVNEWCRKWEPTGAANEDTDSREYSLIPVLRLSEIYYILTETLLDSDLAEAETVFKNIRSRRSQTRIVNGKTAIEEELVWEYRKEFMTEGQTFFYFKRLNKAIETTLGIITPHSFVVPKPDNESVL